MSAVTYPLPRNAVTGRNAINAILWGGLIAGALDATDGVVAYGFQGLNPIQALTTFRAGQRWRADYESSTEKGIYP
jgi:hypothetical protein